MSESELTNWQRVQKIFAEAVELTAAERLSFVRKRCDGDENLYVEIATLVEDFDTAIDALESPPVVLLPDIPKAGIESDTVPGYKIHGEIHRGGQGVVYRATQLGTGREVALKFTLSGPFASESSLLRFRREVELASRLRHPGIVPVFDSGVAAGQPYYVMEFVNGLELQQYVARHDPDVTQKLKLIADVCDAVASAHGKGIIHRDLKPSNIMVTDEHEIRVLDFGLARSQSSPEERLSMTGQVMGTLSYMSPEQAGGRRTEIDVSTDVYSLAVVLYELLSDRLPYKLNGSVAENLITIQSCQPDPLDVGPDGVNAEVAAIVHKALSQEKSRRYPDAAAFGADIRRYLNGDPIEARADRLTYVLWRKLKRNAVSMSLVLALVVGVILGVWGAGYGAPPPPVAAALAVPEKNSKYGAQDLDSQLEAVRALQLRGTSDRELLDEFTSRFGHLNSEMFTDLSTERRVDLQLMLQTTALLEDSPSRQVINERLSAISSPGVYYSGRARDAAAAVLEAAARVGGE